MYDLIRIIYTYVAHTLVLTKPQKPISHLPKLILAKRPKSKQESPLVVLSLLRASLMASVVKKHTSVGGNQ